MIEELHASDPARLGSYRLVGRLGDGGMGRVYLARSPGGRKVAVKVIRSEFVQDADFRARFTREVEAAKRVGGIFTAPVVDADPDCDQPWLATAYVEGKSLGELVRDQGPLDSESVLRLAAGLAEGLAAIHRAGVIHRDLKPSNVLMAADRPRIIDFGISRPMDAGVLTSSGDILGSPGFMSPEQAEGRPVGPAADIFSLGAVLTFAATGDGPFGSARDTVLMYRVIYTAPNLSRVPAAIRPLIERCLAMDPAQRPTPETILAELPLVTQSGAGHPQSAAPPPSGQPATNARVFGGPVKIDNRGYPGHVGQPGPPPLPVIGPAAPVRPSRKRRGWLAYYAVAAALIVAAGAVIAGHIAGQRTAPPEAGPGTSSSPSASVTSPAGPDPAAVVRTYIRAIQNGNLAKALALGGKDPGQGFQALVTGLATDASIDLMSLSATGDTVTARAKETGFDGGTDVISLTFTVIDGVITVVREHTS